MPDDDNTILNAWADDVVALERQLFDARAERDAYRQLLTAALEQLSTLTAALKWQRHRVAVLLDELRTLRRGEDCERRAA